MRTRNRIQEQEQNPNYPIKNCSFCLESSRLSFDPLETPQLFNAWSCPHCGVTNKLIWEYNYNPNSHQLIQNILVTFHQAVVQSSIQYHTYKLPVLSPEKSNPGVIVMTCNTLNILDIQKKNRKKLSFS